MKTECEGQLVRIYIGEGDRWEGRPLYEAIIRTAREHGLAGATALRGIEGFGASSRIHTVKVLRLSEDLPIVVEIIDTADRIAAFMPTIDKMVSEGLVTIERINMIAYRHQPENELAVEDDELQLESDESPSAPAVPNAQPTEFSKATDRARKIIDVARKSAAKSRRVYVDSIDVLLAMLRESEGIAGNVLRHMRIDIDMVERCLREEVSRDETSGAFLAKLNEKAIVEARWLDHLHAGTEHLLLALCEIRPCAATDVLMRLGTQPRDVCKEVLQILGHDDDWQRWLADHPDM